ncbi:MAG: LysM peptidoglycan-binding domain-containing protein [Acidimicrobiales bacterium]
MPTRTRPRSRPTFGQLAEGLGALVVLAAGLVGIPAVLATIVGWPLPHHLPTGAQVEGAFRAPIPDSFWPHFFASLGWLAWVYFVFSVAANVVAHLRGRRSNRRPRLGTSGAVATLITAVIVLSQFRASPTASALAPVPVPVVQLVADTTAPGNAPLFAAQHSAIQQSAVVTHTVVGGDTLWGIAVTYYGDGEKWQAIYQANVGVRQPGGGMLTDSHWIYPGWTLTIPDVAQAVPVAPAAPAEHPNPPEPAPAPAPATHTTNGISHPTVAQPTPAARTSGVPRSEVDPIPAARLRHIDPPAPVPAPNVHIPPAAQHHGVASHDPVGTQKAGNAPHSSAAAQGDDIGTLAIGAGVFGLAAIGLVGTLDRRRRRQTIRRAPGRRIPLPAQHSPLADLELQLRHYARADGLLWLTRLADLLAFAADRAGTARPDVLGVHVRPHGFDVLVVDGADEAPTPFESRAGEPDIWYLPVTADPSVLDDTVVAEPVPLTLFSVGQGSDGTLLVNLEHYRTVHIDVDTEDVPGTLAAIGTELAAATGGTAPTVLAVGFGHGVIDRLVGGIVTDDLDSALAHPRTEGNTIVLAGAAALTGQHANLVADTTAPRMVTAGPTPPAGVDLVIDPANPTFDAHHLNPVDPAFVCDETLAHVEALLDLSEAPTETRSDDESYRLFDVAPTPLGPATAGPVILGLLGEPTIAIRDGEARDLVDVISPTAERKARRVAELLVYLAAHDGTATRGQWLTDVSPEKALSDGYIRNLVLLTRRSLEAVTGIPDLLAYDRGTQRFTLAESIRSDWTMFRSLSASREPEGLRAALSLVRGIPFGCNPEAWTSASGISYAVVGDVTDAAASLGEHALSVGDRQLAGWAARQGQLASRYEQCLWRVLLRAADDSAERQRVWHELNALLAVDGDTAADLDPTTVDLYNSLASERPRSGDVVVLQDEDEAVIPTRQAV